MAPTKKRDKDASMISNTSVSSVDHNNSTSGLGGGSLANNTANNNTSVNCSLDGSKQMNGQQPEHELFLQAFEKPTQIYRYLQNRHGTSPIYLNRTLSYMRERMSRNNKKRTTFKVDTILETVQQKNEPATHNYMNIIYSGLFDKGNGNGNINVGEQYWNSGDAVCIQATLYKITKSKRKDSTSDFQELMSQTSNVIYNPHEDISQFATLCIPIQLMEPFGDQHTIYKLLFRTPVSGKNDDGNNADACDTSKRRKMLTKILCCELILYEKHVNLLPEGDYEAAMQELCSSTSIKSFSPKKRTWETLPENYIPLSMKFDVFNQNPILKFRITTSSNEIPATIEAKDITKYNKFTNASSSSSSSSTSLNSCANGGTLSHQQNGVGESQINHNNNCIKRPIKADKIQIIYNFLYNNNTCQQTEYTQEVYCPWCGLDCLRLYSLLKHLKLCHARFNFTYQPAGHDGARIDVTINDAYDGSYAGSPYDLAGPSGRSFARTCGPVRRSTVTNLLVCRPRRQKTGLDEFLELDEDELSNNRSYITGHNRLYHHTETCLPVHPKELDYDSEGESDPLWLRQKTVQMIDEFTDVNEGEKEIMKLWNLHVMKHGFVGDSQLPLALEMFLDANGREIIKKNLYRNFILHVCNLFDYGLISPETVYKTVQKLQGIISVYPEGQELMSKQREEQLKYWVEVGVHKQVEQQKLKIQSPQKQPNGANANNNTNANGINTSANGNNSTTTGANTESKTMHPPTTNSNKRTTVSATTKRNLHLSNGIAAAEKLLPPKAVAKKSVTQDDEPTTSLAAAREKRYENGLKRHSAGATTTTTTTAAATARATATQNNDKSKATDNNKDVRSAKQQRYSADSKLQTTTTTTTSTTTAAATKRRLVVRETTLQTSTPLPSSKRSRSDTGTQQQLQHHHQQQQQQHTNGNITAATRAAAAQHNQRSTTTAGDVTVTTRHHAQAAAAAAAAAASTSNTTTRQTANHTLPPTRSVTRRQSVAVTNATAAANRNNRSLQLKLRTRLSVPLTKIDKR